MTLGGSAEEMVYQGVRDEMRRRGEPLRGVSLIPRLPPGQVAPEAASVDTGVLPQLVRTRGSSQGRCLLSGGGGDEGRARARGGRLPDGRPHDGRPGLPLCIQACTPLLSHNSLCCTRALTPERQRTCCVACSIHMALLPPEQQEARWRQQGGQGAFRALASAQLASRLWVIRNGAGAVESEVQGEGVIGEYPLLLAGARAAPVLHARKQGWAPPGM